MEYKVRRRGGFSDRNCIKAENVEMQYRNFDVRTRNALNNMISKWYSIIYENRNYYDYKPQCFFKTILRDVYAEFIDDRLAFYGDQFFEIIHKTIIKSSYDDVLTLIEAIAQYWSDYNEDVVTYIGYSMGLDNPEECIFYSFNEVLKKEYVGYRFVNGIIVQITDENEIESIEKSCVTPYSTVNEHMSKATSLLSDRDNPDYENSIKESISAVEAICVEILGKCATLGAALKQLKKNGVTIHPSMKSAFEKLYGYTSDANGIRHAGNIGGPSSTFDEAKFMLVSCSAFVNYLIGVSAS